MPYLPLGKFSSGRDDVLYSMCMQEWANQSDGDSESPTGYFWLICNSNDELLEIADAFGDEIQECEVKFAEIRGNFIVSTGSQGFVYVESFDTPELALAKFEALSTEYWEWDSDSE